MKSAFSLIEILFVMIIIGIIFIVSTGSTPKYTLDNEATIIKFYINQTQFLAMKNNTYDKNASWETTSNNSCIDFQDLNNSQFNDNDLNITAKITTTIPSHIICYDYLGRVYKDDLKIANLLTDIVVIKIRLNPDERNITITPYTGYAYIGDEGIKTN